MSKLGSKFFNQTRFNVDSGLHFERPKTVEIDPVFTGSRDFSISFFFLYKPGANANVIYRQEGTNTFQVYLLSISGYEFRFLIDGETAEFSKKIPEDQWQHAVFTYNSTSGDVSFYLNGKLEEVITLSPNLELYSGDTTIGGRYNPAAPETTDLNILHLSFMDKVISSKDVEYIYSISGLMPSNIHKNIIYHCPFTQSVAGIFSNNNNGTYFVKTAANSNPEGFFSSNFIKDEEDGYLEFYPTGAVAGIGFSRVDQGDDFTTLDHRLNFRSFDDSWVYYNQNTNLNGPSTGYVDDGSQLWKIAKEGADIVIYADNVELFRDASGVVSGDLYIQVVSVSGTSNSPINNILLNGNETILGDRVNQFVTFIPSGIVYDAVEQYNYAKDPGTTQNMEYDTNDKFLVDGSANVPFTEGNTLTPDPSNGALANAIYDTASANWEVGMYLHYELLIRNWTGDPRITFQLVGPSDSSVTENFPEVSTGADVVVSGVIENQGTATRAVDTTWWDINDASGIDVDVSIWRLSTSAFLPLESNNGSTVNYSQEELGIDNLFNQNVFDRFYEKDNVINNYDVIQLVIDTTKTDEGSETGLNQYKLPTLATGNYDFMVYWGDNSNDHITEWDQSETLHTYDVSAVYTVNIVGTFEGMQFAASTDRKKLIKFNQDGAGLKWTEGSRFYSIDNCEFLNFKADIVDTTNMNLFLQSIDFPIPINLDVRSIKVDQCTNLSRMFYRCDNLITIDMSGWDTANVTTMEEMFTNCSDLVELDLTHFDTANVTNMGSMLRELDVSILDLSNFDTGEVTDMSYMFHNSTLLSSLDISGWNTSKVTDMTYMFQNIAVSELDINHFDVSIVTSFFSTLRNLSNLTELDLSNWVTNSAITMDSMFFGCASLNTLDISNFVTDNVTDMDSMFRDCFDLETLDLTHFNTSNVSGFTFMFHRCNSLTSLDVSSFDVSNATSLTYMFSQCESLTELDIANWDVSNISNFSLMFRICTNLQTLDVSLWNTSSATDMNNMFIECASLNALELGGWDTSKVTNMSNMFHSCGNLPITNMGNWDVSACTNFTNFLFAAQLQTSDYDALLNQNTGWISRGVQPGGGSDMNFGTSQYTLADADVVAGRNALISAGWNVIDGGGI